jgi:hypothetical protein
MLKRTARYRGSISADLRDLLRLWPSNAKLVHSRNTPCRGITRRSGEAVTVLRRELLPALIKPVYCSRVAGHRVAGHRVASHSFTKPGLIYVWN